MGYNTGQTFWSTIETSDETKSLVDRLFSPMDDTYVVLVGEELADNIFTSDGISLSSSWYTYWKCR
jgi:hypothetical protein